MAGVPNNNQASQQQTAELAPGLPFAPRPEFQSPEPNLAQVLSTIAGTGLNILGAATGRGAAGNQVLSSAQQLGDRQNEEASRKFRIAQQQATEQSAQEVAKSLFPEATRFSGNERNRFVTLLQNSQINDAQSMLRQQEVDAKGSKDDFNRLKSVAMQEVKDLERSSPREMAPVIKASQEFLSRVDKDTIKDDSPEGRKKLVKQFLSDYNSKNVRKLSQAEAEGLISQGVDYYNQQNSSSILNPISWFTNKNPKDALADYDKAAAPAFEENDAAARAAKERIELLKRQIQKAAAAKGGQRGRAYEELMSTVMGGNPEAAAQQRVPADAAVKPPQQPVMMLLPPTKEFPQGRKAPIMPDKIKEAEALGAKRI
jgi:hypothetical protein